MNAPKFGVYLMPNGNLKVLEPHDTKPMWVLDEGKSVSHPIFRVRIPIVKEMSRGWPLFDFRCELKGSEYLGDL